MLIVSGEVLRAIYIKSFNGKLRDECLNQNWFISFRDAREATEAWRTDYNEFRPHSSLGDLSPLEYALSTVNPQN
jgi:putative transposase